MSTTHLAMVAALGEEEAIAGVSGTDLIYNSGISQRINEGLIYDVGYESGMNNELIIRLSPDLIMIYGIGSESAGYTGKIKELGIKVMFNADYLETDPLGKAEWIKLFGALFCKEKMADSIFNSVSESYNRIKAFVSQNSEEKPEVLLGLPFRDTWFISPGNSYAGRFIEDAGGNYLWHDTESSVSMPYSIEDVFLRSLKADYWLNIGSVSSKREIYSLDSRLESIPCCRNGNTYNNNKRISPAGGNDYWESGILNPHLILKDIATILHPELFPDTELFYYRKIE
jgi:iron complex transport system substrate-binding protein